MLSTHRHTTWKKRPSAEKMAPSVQFVSISLALACLQRSIPKLRGLTLSKLNNLFIVTLNLLSCYNCFCNILPDISFFFFQSRHDWNQSWAACSFHGDKICFFNDFDLQLLQLFERQLAELLPVKPNVSLCQDSNFTFQIIYWFYTDTGATLCLISPIKHFLWRCTNALLPGTV